MCAPCYRVFGWLFPRLLAGIYFIAFGSWWTQADALTGEKGLMPVPRFLDAAGKFAAQEGFIPWLRWPSVFWMGFSDGFASALCIGGCVVSVLVMAGVFQGPLLLMLWVGYLSIVTTSDVFMSFQWDALLLETGFIAMLIAPWRPFVGRLSAGTPSPSRVQMLLPQVLLFKLMFLSGVVKLASGDPSWLNFTAMQFHYETQPLPSWTAWWAHQLPTWMQTASCVLMFVIELVMPLVLAVALLLEWRIPSKPKMAQALKVLAAGSFTLLMLLVMGTGSYCFFNLLAILLALSALDDGCWPQSWQRRLQTDAEPPPPPPRWRRSMQTAIVAVMLFFSFSVTLQRVRIPATVVPEWSRPMAEAFGQWQTKEFPATLSAMNDTLAAFTSVNSYGLFAVMTTQRKEIEIQVSDDGVYFLPLEFKWKPGNLARVPAFVAPHQPRLDWQMWFAALHPGFVPARDMKGGNMVWFGELLAAIINHNEKVLALMRPPPFPVEKIRAVRAQIFVYHFTDRETRKKTGEWWVREPVGAYSPKFSRRDP